MNPNFPLHIQKALREIEAQRDEIMTACVAKYGFHPDELQQIVHFDQENNRVVWYMEKKGTPPHEPPSEDKCHVIKKEESNSPDEEKFKHHYRGYLHENCLDCGHPFSHRFHV